MKVINKWCYNNFVIYIISMDYVLEINQRLISRWLTTTRYLKFKIIKLFPEVKSVFLNIVFAEKSLTRVFI